MWTWRANRNDMGKAAERKIRRMACWRRQAYHGCCSAALEPRPSAVVVVWARGERALRRIEAALRLRRFGSWQSFETASGENRVAMMHFSHQEFLHSVVIFARRATPSEIRSRKIMHKQLCIENSCLMHEGSRLPALIILEVNPMTFG